MANVNGVSKGIMQGKSSKSVSFFKNKKALTIVGSLVALVLFGLVAGVAYYYVTYGELPTLTASSAGDNKCNDRQKRVCSKNKKGEEVCKCEKGAESESGGRKVNGTQLCGCKKYDGSGNCTSGARYWQTEEIQRCRCYNDKDSSYWGQCIKPPAGVYKSDVGCSTLQNIVCKAN